jgi:hypothetical protein
VTSPGGFTTTVVIVSLKPNLVGFVLSDPQHFRETTAVGRSGPTNHHGVFMATTCHCGGLHCQVLGDGLLLRLLVTASMEKAVRSTVQAADRIGSVPTDRLNDNKSHRRTKTTNNNNPTAYSYHNKASYQEWSDRRLAWERRAWTFMEGVHAGVNSSQWELTYSRCTSIEMWESAGLQSE